MNIFTNKEITRFLLLLLCILAGFIVLSQVILWRLYGMLNPAVFALSLLTAACIAGAVFLYFRKQNRLLEDAISQINRYLSGDTDARIESCRDGSLYKLFHAVNTLATNLDAQASREQKTKQFLKETISDISHQLKTPLAALCIYNELMLDDTEDLEAIRKFAAKSGVEIDRIETLVQSLLKITKLDAGAILLEKSQQMLADMLEDVRLYFEFRALQEQKTISLCGPRDAVLFCDRTWLVEAVSNLVKNALDHTTAGGHIEISWQSLPSLTQITVCDDGSGIHPADIHHIFKRFYRSRFSKDTQGLGLGLALAKAIIEAHGGSLTADSVPGRGSAFFMDFVLQNCKPEFMRE